MKPSTALARDEDKLNNRRVKLQARIRGLIREQEEISLVAEQKIEKVNRDLKALRFRLEPYTREKNPRDYDENYYDLKDRYENLLEERDMLERTRMTADESIAAAKLNLVQGQMVQETGREGNL